jgi:hypothetical protein
MGTWIWCFQVCHVPRILSLIQFIFIGCLFWTRHHLCTGHTALSKTVKNLSFHGDFTALQGTQTIGNEKFVVQFDIMISGRKKYLSIRTSLACDVDLVWAPATWGLSPAPGASYTWTKGKLGAPENGGLPRDSPSINSDRSCGFECSPLSPLTH